jgi:hypothetical protein
MDVDLFFYASLLVCILFHQNKTRYIPILTIGGEAGIGNFTTTSFQKIANHVTGLTLQNTGHFIPEERPNLLTKQILEFFK